MNRGSAQLHTYIFAESLERVAVQVCQDKLPELVRGWWNERLADDPEIRLPELLHEYIIDMCNNLEEDDDWDEDMTMNG